MQRSFSFWVMVLAMIFHSLTSTIWTEIGFFIWLTGIFLIWVLYEETKGGFLRFFRKKDKFYPNSPEKRM